MDTTTAQRIVSQTFQAGFDTKRYRDFINELCNGFDESKKQTMQVPDAFAPHVASCQRLGTYESPDGELADVMVVHLTESFKLERTRTALRDFVAHKLKRGNGDDNSYKEAGLVAFVAPDARSWRFSLVRMEYATRRDPKTGKIKPEERLTPARRFSYLVGADEQCHTARSRFVPLLQDTTDKPTLAQIEEAFSVEKVTKEFFNQYAALFQATCDELEKLLKKDAKMRADFQAKNVSTVDFAKKLLGQIVFLYFIQKKGWLGVAKGGNWGDGPRNFLRRLVEAASPPLSSNPSGVDTASTNFFNDVLEPLFYDTLATDRSMDGDLWKPKNGVYDPCRIPFLNGGLFEPLAGYDWKGTEIRLPNSLFTNRETTKDGDTGTGILDVFDRYNFTVNEAEPLEKEVAIDPEMLGKVFENLIEENRRKGLGAYYTPREIVHYMCQESLINYLDTALIVEAASPSLSSTKAAGTPLRRADIEALIREGEQASHYEAARKDGTVSYRRQLPKAVEKHAQALDDALASITVCDPAIGSGAFPVGMMTEIVRARMALNPYLVEATSPSHSSPNPSGVSSLDSQKSGGDAASTLRTPYHFKRHAIQNSLYGVDIDPGAVEIAKLRLWLSLVVDEEDVRQIQPLPNLDYKVVVGNSLLGVEKDLFNIDAFNKLERLKPQFFNASDHSEKVKLKRQIDALIEELCGSGVPSLSSSNKSGGDAASATRFDFEIFFSEVFHARKGFDVVIANPPYVSVEKFARTEQQAAWKRTFKTFAARGDIYCFFYEKGLALLRREGVLTFITSNKFQRAGYGKALRELLASQRLRAVIDFCELPVFAAATDPIIVIAQKSPADTRDTVPVVVIKDEEEFETLPQSLRYRGASYKPSQLKADGWSLEGGDGLALLDKIRSKGTPLGDYVHGRFYYGIKTGLNEAFVIDAATRKRLIAEDKKSAELIKPWIRGKDIRRWTHEFHDLYVIIVRYGFHTQLKNYPAILKHLTRFKEQLQARGQCLTSRGGGSEGQHHWLELDNNPTEEYLAEFNETKIVFNETSKRLHAYLDTKKHLINKTGFIIVTKEAEFVLAVVNSSVLDWLYRSTFPSWGDPWRSGRIQFRGSLMQCIPIPPADAATKSKLTTLAGRAAKLAAAGDAAGVAQVEREIDAIVYRLFDLTPAEIALIETALAPVRGHAVTSDAA